MGVGCSYFLVVIWLIWILGSVVGESQITQPDYYEGTYESKLLTDLFESGRYDKRARPVPHPSIAVNVSFVLDLYQIISVDGKSQSISLFCWVYEYWHDNRLHWRPERYGDLDQLSIDYKQLWIPDTTLINNIQMDLAEVEHKQSVIINLLPQNRTQMFFPRTAQYTVGCMFDVQYFPFDMQNCSLTFASWAYDETKIDYFLPNTQTTFEAYQESDEWDVESFDIHKREIQYNCCERPYTMIFGHLIIRRKPLYYVVNLVLPTLIISLIASVGLFANSRNSGKEDKVNLGITTLLALSILLLTVSDQIPKGSSSVPLLGWFYLAIMLHLSLETLLAVYLSHPQNEKRLATCFSFCKNKFINRPKFTYRRRETPANNQTAAAKAAGSSPMLGGGGGAASNNGYLPKNGQKTAITIASRNQQTPPALVRPGNVCMIFNVVLTIVITFGAFSWGMIKGGSLG